MSNFKSTRDGFSRAINKLGENENIYVLTADFRESVGVSEFAEKYPKRFIECGIAEQNMLGIASGLANENKIPFSTSVASFQPARNWDQLRVSVCLSNANVKVISSHGGFSNSKDGANQQSFEDFATTRVLPNLKVIIPADYTQAVKATLAIARDKGPSYLRLSKEQTPEITDTKDTFEIGKAQVLLEGKDLTVISAGPILWQCLQAIEKVNASIELINLHTIKPIDIETILTSIKKTKKVLTVEDHQIFGGLGSAVSELLVQNYPVKQRMLGLNDTFTKSARSIGELYKLYKLDKDSIANEIKKFVEED